MLKTHSKALCLHTGNFKREPENQEREREREPDYQIFIPRRPESMVHNVIHMLLLTPHLKDLRLFIYTLGAP